MNIPLVQENSVQQINASLISLKNAIESIEKRLSELEKSH